jgi:lysophospholipase L1-like esterase
MTCPADETVTSPNGKPFPVTFAPETSGGQTPVTVTCDPASESAFGIGTTTVSCEARDAAGQTASCQFSVRVLKPPRIKYTRFVAFGDSITEGETGTSLLFGPRIVDSAHSYPTLLGQMLSARYTAQKITVVNEGRGGELAVNATPRLLSVLSADRPQVVILSEGSNDLNGGASHIKPASDAMEDMARKIVESGRIAIVGTVPPMREGLRRAGCPECVVPYNARVVMLTSRRGAQIVDIYPLINSNITALIGVDGLHPTAEGYQVIAQAYFDAIVKLFETDPGGAIASAQARHDDHH